MVLSLGSEMQKTLIQREMLCATESERSIIQRRLYLTKMITNLKEDVLYFSAKCPKLIYFSLKKT